LRDDIRVTEEIELIYNAAVADEKLKDGTKYEQLTAIVFKIVQDSAVVVHDVSLRGDGTRTPHQIDVRISCGQHTAHRILVECKEHGPGTKVSLSEVRDFNGALIQLQPARGIFVTTSEYTRNARTYALEENITLVELRPFADQDWSGRLRQIHVTAEVYTFGTPDTDWIGTGHTTVAPGDVADISGGTWTDDASYYDEHGVAQGSLTTLLNKWKRDLNASGVPMDGTSERTGTYTLPNPVWLPIGGVLAEVAGFAWRVPVEHTTQRIEVHEGERIADLILLSVQLGSGDDLPDAIAAGLREPLGHVFFRDQINLWEVGEDHVVRLRMPG
jgi:hypothetical protein